MISGVGMTQCYVSSDAVEPAAANEGQSPSTLTSFDAARAGEFDDDYHTAYLGILPSQEWPTGLIRQVGAMTDGRIAIYEDLEGALDIKGLEYIECIMAIAAQEPRALGTRYLS
jgi:hypothetical protein